MHESFYFREGAMSLLFDTLKKIEAKDSKFEEECKKRIEL